MKRHRHHSAKQGNEHDLDYEEWHAAISRHWERKAAQLRARRLRKLHNHFRDDHSIFSPS